MIPQSQFRKKLSVNRLEDGLYFATNDGIYFGADNFPIEKISNDQGVLALTIWKKRLLAGKDNGEIKQVMQKRILQKRKGKIHKFIHGDELYDVSEGYGEFFISQTLKDEEVSPAWLADSPEVHWVKESDIRKGLALREDDGEIKWLNYEISEFRFEIHARVLEASGRLHLTDYRFNKFIPEDAEDILHHNNNLYFLNGSKGIEQIIIATGIRTRLFPDHYVTCFIPGSKRIRQVI